LSTKVIPEKANGLDIYVELSYIDTGEEYTLHLKNDILIVTEGIEAPENLLSLDTETHKKIITKDLSIGDAIKSGLVDFNGSTKELKLFFNSFER